MKSKTLPLAVVIAIIGCGLAIYANMNSADFKNVLEQERSKRFAAEQQLLKAQQKIGALETELGSAKSKMSSIEQILTDGSVAQKKLMLELEKVKKERELFQRRAEEAASQVKAAQEIAAQAQQAVEAGMPE